MSIHDIVNDPSKPSAAEEAEEKNKSSLGSHCLHLLQRWEDERNTKYRKRWVQYKRLWRGIWSEEDRQRKSERSQLISPALAQAIESLVAEAEEGIFASGRFFDIDPDVREEDKQNVTIMRDLLYNDMLSADVDVAVTECILNGAVYGTGIGKIVVDTIENKYIVAKPVNGLSEVLEAGLSGEEEVVIRLVPVSPTEFVIEGAAKSITDALGVGHITTVPEHVIEKRIQDGVYNDVPLSTFSTHDKLLGGDEDLVPMNHTGVRLYEYHGLVPLALLSKELLDLPEAEGDDDDGEMIEVIVTLTESAEVLRAITNPNRLGDRNFLAFQFDTLPNQFWGRGAAEKGFNAQMALDGELRSRVDGMALAIHPMMGVDASAMPRGSNLTVSPGRSILTNGNPKEILAPLNFGSLGTDTFTQSADLERQVSKATGAMDDSQISANNAKTGAMGMAMSGSIKRSKRTLSNIERQFISPMVHKFAWRYMQYAPDKYPVVDNPKFKVVTSQGIMAKEWEVTQLGNMLKTVSPESPSYWMLLKGIFQNSSIKNREVYEEIIEGQLQRALNPQPSPMEVAQMEAQKAELKISHARARAELLRIELEAQKLEAGNMKTYTESVLNLAKAESEEVGNNISEYSAILNRIKVGLETDQKKRDFKKEQEATQQQQQGATPPA